MYPSLPFLDDHSQLIRDNMPLVEFVVQRMTPQVPSFMTKEDMISAAMVGLVDAANKFNPDKGIKFKTFAEYRVRGAILDEMRKLDWFSRSMREKQSHLTQTMLQLERRLGRSPEEEEMADAMDLDLEKYRYLLNEVSHLGCVSLHDTLDHTEEGRRFLDNLEDIDGPAPSDLIEKEEMARVMADFLKQLTHKEQQVIALYYYEELSQKEIAEVLNISEGRISQLHSQALAKLRVKMMNSEYYEP